MTLHQYIEEVDLQLSDFNIHITKGAEFLTLKNKRLYFLVELEEDEQVYLNISVIKQPSTFVKKDMVYLGSHDEIINFQERGLWHVFLVK